MRADPLTRSRRLVSHGLARGASEPTVTAVVERLGAVQAQDLAAAKWVLGARAPGSTVADVDAALNAARIMRSWLLRGTLHFVAPEELRPILSLTAEREIARSALQHRREGLDGPVFDLARAVAERELSGGRSLAREALQERWEAAGIDTGGQRGYHLIWVLAFHGVLAPGPVDGRVQRFVLLDEWQPPRPVPERDEVLGRLFARYIGGHGPATVRDFAWWSGLTLGDARRALAVAADEVEAVGADAAGEARYASAGLEAPARPSGAHALAAFDEYFIGYGDRVPVCEPRHLDRVVPGRNGVFQPTLVDRGRVVGLWKRAPKGDGVLLDFFDAADAASAPRFARSLRAWARFAGRGEPEIEVRA